MDRSLAIAMVGLLVAGALAGCVNGIDGPTGAAETPTLEETRTPYPDREVEFPDGPKDRPERPAELTGETAGEFVRTHEYRYAYNVLWVSEDTDVTLDCEVRSVDAFRSGYEIVVSCTGSSNTRGEGNGTATATPVHADWFTQVYTYYVDEDSIVRERRGDSTTDSPA